MVGPSPLYCVTDGKYVLRDAQGEAVAQLPTPEPIKVSAAPSDSAIKRLPRSSRALYEWSNVLHAMLSAKTGLSPEHEHRIMRAGEALAEINQLSAAFTKRPTSEYVKNVEASLNAILRDMEAIKDELDAALERQAAVLATFTREVTGR